MLLKIEDFGRYKNLFFRCPKCNRYFSGNFTPMRDAALWRQFLSILSNACVCDDCARKKEADK